jgi:Holliday junction resolvase RusA-like endonuclease
MDQIWRRKYKIFHATTTEHYRLNTITSLDTTDGRTLSDHHGKASLLWEEYKARLGCSAQTHMHFNLLALVQQHNLQHIKAPFTKEDIDNVVKKLPTDKAPAPNDFNRLFLKKSLAHYQRGYLPTLF